MKPNQSKGLCERAHTQLRVLVDLKYDQYGTFYFKGITVQIVVVTAYEVI